MPATATVAKGYEARMGNGYGAAFFDVVASGSVTSAPLLLPLAVSPNAVVGGANATGTVTLDAPAPTGGATVTLICFDSNVSIPANITIPAGQASAQFTITTQIVTVGDAPSIYALYNGVRSAIIDIAPSGGSPPAAPTNLTATGGPGEVALAWTAPTGADSYNVKRSTTSGHETLIATGVTTTGYLDTAVTNGTPYYYVVSGVNVYGESGNSNEAEATPNAGPPVAGLTLLPTSVMGGLPSVGTVTLASAAPSGGAPVALSSNNGTAATVPSSVTVSSGQISTQFVVSTSPVTVNTAVTITATYGTQVQATMTVLAPSVLSVALAPNPVAGGNSSSGTVTLSARAGVSGATVSLSSSNTGVATVSPSSIAIPSGSATGTFTCNTSTVTSSQQVTITATGTAYCNGSAGALLTVNPAAINCYIVSLTLNPTAVTGAGASTGTVTLSTTAPTGGALVTLRSTDSTVTVPASVTVPAGAQTATVTVTVSGEVSAATYVTILGTYNTWTQSAVLAELPSGTTISVQNLTATPGNGCVLLDWQDLPEGSVLGYNIYRNGSTTPLNSTPVPSAIYGDTGLTNGTLYQYTVTVVNLQGQEGGGASTSSTPSSSAPTFTWNSPPSVATGLIDVYGTLSDNGAPEGYLLADGAMTGGLANDLGDTSSPPPGNTQAEWDSTTASNASHALQALGYDGTWAFVSTPLSVTASNSFSAWTGNDVLVQSDGDPAWAQMTAPAGTVSWTVQIADPTGNLVRSWSGVGTAVQFSWDGTNASGAPVSQYGQYAASVTAFDGSGGRTVLDWEATVAPAPPQGLALLEYCFADDQADVSATDDMAHWVSQALQGLESFSGSFTSWVLTETQRAPARKIASWIQHSVTDFYVASHGLVPRPVAGAAIATPWRNMVFWPFHIGPPNGGYHGWYNVSINSLLGGPGGREYHFAFCDFCRSAGSTADGLPGPQDYTWAHAFNIALPGVDPFLDRGTFWGWDGDVPSWTFASGVRDNWYWWDHWFWWFLGGGLPHSDVADAALQATLATQDMNINQAPSPWDSNPANGDWWAQMFGDPIGSLP